MAKMSLNIYDYSLCIFGIFATCRGMYPGRDYRLKEDIANQWAEYKKCLQDRKESMGQHLHPPARYLYVLPGTTHRLSCRPCLSPFSEPTDFEWRHSYNRTPLHIISQDKELEINNARPYHSGWYACYQGNSLQQLYYLLTVDNPPLKQISAVEDAQTAAWGPWTECSACGSVGRRTRYGLCTTDLDKELATRFTGPITCFSHIKPPSNTQHNITNYAVVELCEEPCKNETVEDFVKLTNVLSVERQLVDVKEGAAAVLQCPGIIEVGAAITWKAFKSSIVPELIAQQTKGRISVDLLNRLVFNKTELRDTHIYSCWDRKRLVGTMTLTVEQETKDRGQFTLKIVTSIMVVTLLLYVASRALIKINK